MFLKGITLTGTIRENMRWRNENADDNEIINALKTAQAYDFIFEKDGLDTSVSQEGKNFPTDSVKGLRLQGRWFQTPRF